MFPWKHAARVVVVSSALMMVLAGVRVNGASPQSNQKSPDAVVHVGVTHDGPRLISGVKPRLPEAAKRAGQKGPVLLEAQIDEKGAVKVIKVARGHPLLNDTATRAVSKWKYAPVIFEGRPIAVKMIIVVSFRNP
jgi:TonB family protein